MSFSDKKNGYIYLRNNPWFQMENVYKMGISFSLLDRGDTYKTGEFHGGHFSLVIDVGECSWSRLRVMENLLAHHFHSYHRYHEGGGREFYDRSMIDHIPSFLFEQNIPFRILQEDDIQNRIRYEQHQKYKHLLRRMFDRWTHQYQNALKPYDFQRDVLQHIPLFFEKYNRLKLIWPCGLGKALFSIFVVKKMRFKTVLIGVPSIDLQKQMKKEILRIFPETDNILCIGSVETTSKEIMTNFMLKDTHEPRFVITTYQSCHLFRDMDFIFDFKIGDEAHHLVGTSENSFCAFHEIKSAKSLFMTATEKTHERKHPSNEKIIYSMDDEDVFGYCIDRKTVRWAIENKKITDYSILVLKNTEEEVDAIIRKSGFCVEKKELFLSCYMCLKAMEKYEGLTHMLLYTNKVDHTMLTTHYIDMILSKGLISFDADDFYNNALHSPQHSDTIHREKEKFKQSRRGIISCVYLFGEGCDMPQLNAVCVADNMQSEIRIVQYLLRPNRLDPKNPAKRAFIVIPYMDTDDWERETRSFEKVRKVISQMRNSDDTIEQKLCLCVIQEPSPEEKTPPENQRSRVDPDLFDSGEGLEQLKLRLRWSKTLRSKNTEEEDEYQYIRSLNKSLGITSEKEYILSREKHPQYIENAESYFKTKGVWRGQWRDFLDLHECDFLSLDEWREFCKECEITTREKYEEQCEKCLKLPKDPEMMYGRLGFSNLLMELARVNRNSRCR